MSEPSRDDLAEWIRRVNDEVHKPLTAWEEGFMASITDKFERGVRLSDRELEILERIYTEKTP